MNVKLIKKRSMEENRKIDIHENIEHLNKAHEAASYVSEKWHWHRLSCAPDGENMLSREAIAEQTYGIVKEFLEKS